METSEAIDQIAPALCAAQRALPAVHKSAENPYFKSRYAPLEDVMDAAKVACHAQGLVILQSVSMADDSGFTLDTTLIHTSGQWVRGGLRFPNPATERKDKEGVVHYGHPSPQGVGGAITYARRYSLSALLGIVADDDDDGESVMARDVHTAHAAVTAPTRQRVPPERTAPPVGPGSVDGIPKTCPVCGSGVYDNRSRKASGEYKPTSLDWQCMDKGCKSPGTDGKLYRTGGWVDKKPKEPARAATGPGDPFGTFDELPPVLEEDAPWEP